MPHKRLSIRKIKEVFRLKFEQGQSNPTISRSCGIGRSTVNDYLQRAKRAGIVWPPHEALSEQALEEALFPPHLPTGTARMMPDFAEVHQELKSRKHVSLNLLWQEYKERQPEGYQCSWFCEHYRNWTGKLDLVMPHQHRAGEKLFVDYAGQTVDIRVRHTGEDRFRFLKRFLVPELHLY